MAGGDRLGCMLDMNEVRRTAGFRGVNVCGSDSHVFRHRERTEARRVARAEVAVNVVKAEAGVGERARGNFGVNLGNG